MYLNRIINDLLWQRWKNSDIVQYQILRKGNFPVFPCT